MHLVVFVGGVLVCILPFSQRDVCSSVVSVVGSLNSERQEALLRQRETLSTGIESCMLRA